MLVSKMNENEKKPIFSCIQVIAVNSGWKIKRYSRTGKLSMRSHITMKNQLSPSPLKGQLSVCRLLSHESGKSVGFNTGMHMAYVMYYAPHPSGPHPPGLVALLVTIQQVSGKAKEILQ